MATKQCDKFEFEDDLEIIEVWNDDLKPPPNTPVPSPYQAPVAWGMKSNTSEKDVYCPILYDVSNSKPNSSVFGFGNEPRTKYHHSVHWYSNLSDVLESDSDISVINLGEVPRTKYHHSVHWYPNLSDVFESDSDISVISLGEVPRDVYCPNLADVSKPKSNISVFNFGNEQRRLPADLRLHLSDLEEEAGVSLEV